MQGVAVEADLEPRVMYLKVEVVEKPPLPEKVVMAFIMAVS